MAQLNKTEEFIQLYNRLEVLIRDKYDVSEDIGALSWLIKNDTGFRNVSTELDYCREVRNLLQHRERINGSFAVVPSDAMLALLRDVIRDIEGIPCASDLGVKASGLFSAQVDDRIVPVMEVMHKRSFNLVPILNDGRVVGAFSQKTLFSYLMENGVVGFDPNDRLILLAHLLPLDAHGAETFRFVAADAPAPKVAEVFRDALRRSELMGAVFVTAHGKSDERLLSMITSWDMAAFF